MNKLDFKIRFDFFEHKFYITPKKNFPETQVNIISFNNESIYTTSISFSKNTEYWIAPNTDDKEGIILNIGNFYEKVRLRTKENKIIKPVAINVVRILGVGDFMWITPFIRKLYNIYNQKVTIMGFPQYEEFCENNPYINEFIDKTSKNIKDDNYQIFNVFHEYGAPYWQSNLSQLAAKSAGITLKEDELKLDYFPNEYNIIDELPENYVCIGPRIISPDRTWEKEKWQKLIDKLNENNIPVVAIGKGDSYTDLKIENGINLVDDIRQNNLSQTWHILNKSKIFVTFDTGIYIFAGTTDTHIIQLGWLHNPYWHKPKRENEKYSHIRGHCDIYCGSDLETYVERTGDIRLLPNVGSCLKGINFACKPQPEQVINEVLRIY